jgi:hypothetical protein
LLDELGDTGAFGFRQGLDFFDQLSRAHEQTFARRPWVVNSELTVTGRDACATGEFWDRLYTLPGTYDFRARVFSASGVRV